MITNNVIKLHQADINDIESLIEIEIESHQNQESGKVVDHALNALLLREYKKRWLQKLQNGMSTIMVSFDGQPAGFIAYSLQQDHAEIHNIYVISNLRRHQLGRMLVVNALEQIMKQGVSKVVVWLVKGRVQIIRFYENMGFIATSQSRVDRISHEVSLIEKKYEMIINH